MNDSILSLCWNNHRSTFSHVISNLRDKERYSDVTLACDGKFYAVHKLILSVCSDYFDSILEKTPCKHPVIVLRDVLPQDLEALLAFMYEGIASVPQADLNRLIKTAEFLKVKGLAIPDEPIVVTDGSRAASNTTATVPPVVPNISVPAAKTAAATNGSPPPKKRRREDDAAGGGDGSTSSDPPPSFHAGLGPVVLVPANGEEGGPKTSDFEALPEDPLSLELQGNVTVAPEAGDQQSTLYRVDSIVKDEIKLEEVTVRDDSAAEGGATTTLVSTYGVVVSDGSGNHTLMQTHPEQTHVVHQFDSAQQLAAPAHTQPLAEAVAEALAGPSAIPPWLGTTELVPSAFSSCEAYSTETGDVTTSQAQTIQIVSSQSVRGDVTVTTRSTETLAPIPVTIVTAPVATTPQANGPKGAIRGDGTNVLKCHYCNRATFRQTSDLKRHIRIHTGEKPYECTYCPYRASRKDLLHAHCSKMHNAH